MKNISVKKKNIKNFKNSVFTAFIFLSIAFFSMLALSCKPALGSAWYQGNSNDNKQKIHIKKIKVLDYEVKAILEKKAKTESERAVLFSNAQAYEVELPYEKEVITEEDISVSVTKSASSKEKLKCRVKLKGDTANLIEGKSIPVVIEIVPENSSFSSVTKVIKLTKRKPSQAFIGNLTVCGLVAEKAADFEVSKSYTVTLPSEKDVISSKEIGIDLFSDESKSEEKKIATDKIKIEILGVDEVNIPDTSYVPVIVKIIPPSPYSKLERTIKIKRKEREVIPFETKVSVKEIKIHGKNAEQDEKGNLKVTLPNEISKVSLKDISVKLEINNEAKDEIKKELITLKILSGKTVPLAGGVAAYIALEINVQDPNGKLLKIVEVMREKAPPSQGGETPTPDEEDDDAWNNDDETEEDGSDTPSLPPSSPPFNPKNPDSNPKDKNGKYKWIQKTIVPEIDPFEYYKESSNGFSASKFDEWVVYINDFDNTTYVPSYKFKNGTWEEDAGKKEYKYNGPNFGSGFTKSTNVWFYKYKTRTDRWKKEPPIFDAEKEKRFYFYKFTADIMIGGLDNSLFCVDTHSKFLFYYSDPSCISSQGVPSEWRDYADPTEGKHVHFSEPFYMSDPIGYVKKDGSVVIYKWAKDKIQKGEYTAPKNPAFTEAAGRDITKPGYSPYRNKIKGKERQEWVENEEYTVSPISIKEEPKHLTVMQGAKGWFIEVKTSSVPQGESLSWQWYENTENSNEGGLPVQDGTGGTSSAFYFPTEKDGIKYYYCKITNTNNTNGQKEEVLSKTYKVEVKKGKAIVNFSWRPQKGGTISATLNGKVIESGSEVDRGSVITFTASPSEDYSVGSWVNAVQKADNPLEATLTVTKNITVGVKFKSTKAPPAEKVNLIFFCDEEKGNLKAELNGESLEQSYKGVEVEKGSIITFTAEPKEDYKIVRWIGAEGIKKAQKLTIKENTVISVQFKKLDYPINFECDTEKGSIEATVNGKKINSGDTIDKDSIIIFKAEAKEGYYVSGWENAEAIEGDITKAKLVMSKEASLKKVSVIFKKLFPVTFSYLSEQGSLKVLLNGEAIESGSKVKEGDELTLIATPNEGFYIKKWSGIEDVSPENEKTIIVDKAFNIEVIFGKAMRLIITPKIYNESLKSFEKKTKYVDGVYLAHKLSAAVVKNNGKKTDGTWEEKFKVVSYFGYWLTLKDEHFIKNAKERKKGEAIFDSFFDKPEDGMKIELSNYLLKANKGSGDALYLYAEYPNNNYYPLQAIDDNSLIPLVYNAEKDTWTLDTANVNIKKSDEIPLPPEYKDTKPNPNRKISYKGVDISYDENFTLTKGEEKDFVITYTVNNSETKSEGIIKVIYTISWK